MLISASICIVVGLILDELDKFQNMSKFCMKIGTILVLMVIIEYIIKYYETL